MHAFARHGLGAKIRCGGSEPDALPVEPTAMTARTPVARCTVLIDAGFPGLGVPIPWWGGRSLRFCFPPR